ncbi:malate/lactate/ureidoglycolate dehydrogenase [Caldimonas tepidiphila]|uniref:malate/lactate/ureidoglycolate dehydrogenase n=1 Tax=Caldimonas tepidiphila TaxID=2315841 RepID=UPI000E5B3A52|nr:malate/lactate/ureidoglycolate dehydrogenase [Caldimonas tepidiphila]
MDLPVPTPALHQWVADLWLAAGSSEREAALTADHLVGANLAGHDSHGVGMVPRYVNSWLADELQLNRDAELVQDAGSMLVFDGRRGMGQSVTQQAMARAIERAQAQGVCVMGLRHSHHLGRVGHWAEQAVEAGLVSVHFTNAVSKPIVAPHGGTQGRFVTNPFTVGIPVPGRAPVLLDFATSAIALGKVRVAYNKQVKVPPGSLLDRDGAFTDDPGVMFPGAGTAPGALVPFAGHKGHALAMVCELLGAALIGGDTTRPEHAGMQHAIWNNMLTLLFDPQRLGTAEVFGSELSAFVEWVKSAPLQPGCDGILMPGEPEQAMREARRDAIPIDAGTMAQMDAAAAQVQSARGRSPGPLSALVRENPAGARIAA